MTISKDMNSTPDDTIVADSEILGGMPVIKGTRVPVYDVAASVIDPA